MSRGGLTEPYHAIVNYEKILLILGFGSKYYNGVNNNYHD